LFLKEGGAPYKRKGYSKNILSSNGKKLKNDAQNSKKKIML
jgi:hypothetical protein